MVAAAKPTFAAIVSGLTWLTCFQVDIRTLLASVSSIYAQDQTNKTILERQIYEDD